MTADRSYVKRNDAERARLQALVSGASDADLGRPLPGGWTVAGVLAHLAFWDQRIVVLFDRWEKEGAEPPVEEAEDVAWINDSTKPLVLALPPRRAAEVALAIAEASDRKVETLREDLVARNSGEDALLNLSRADHRAEHLDEIERALGKKLP